MVLTSQKSSWILEKLSFVLLKSLMATTPVVVWAQGVWGLKVWLWPPVAEKVTPAEVLHSYKQSLLSVSHFQ